MALLEAIHVQMIMKHIGSVTGLGQVLGGGTIR